jgi:hypothetical protein
VPSPTGIVMGPPVSMAFMPRTMPSVGNIETVRTRTFTEVSAELQQ